MIAVLVIAACVLAYVRFGGQAGQDAFQQQSQTQQEAPAASSEEGEKSETKAGDDAAKASAEAEALAREQSTPTEEQIFQTLSSEYSALDGYSNRIVSCVDDFNSWYIARDMNKRQASQATAEKVKSDLEAAKAEIENLKVSNSSPYATDAANLIELLRLPDRPHYVVDRRVGGKRAVRSSLGTPRRDSRGIVGELRKRQQPLP